MRSGDVCEFRDDDDDYLAWIADHPDGYVINTVRGHTPAGASIRLLQHRLPTELALAHRWTTVQVASECDMQKGSPAVQQAWRGPKTKAVQFNRTRVQRNARDAPAALVVGQLDILN